MQGFDLFGGLVVEGFEAALLPCTLVLLLSGFATAFMARQFAIPAVVAFWLSTLAFGWARFAGRTGDVNRFVLATLAVAAVGIMFWPPIRRLDWVALAAGGITGFVASSVWLPCVGEAFGTLLGDLPDAGFGGIFLMATYLTGVLSPLLLFAAVHHLTPDELLERVEPVWSIVGGAVLTAFGIAMAFGVHETLVGYLFRWSLG